MKQLMGEHFSGLPRRFFSGLWFRIQPRLWHIRGLFRWADVSRSRSIDWFHRRSVCVCCVRMRPLKLPNKLLIYIRFSYLIFFGYFRGAEISPRPSNDHCHTSIYVETFSHTPYIFIYTEYLEKSQFIKKESKIVKAFKMFENQEVPLYGEFIKNGLNCPKRSWNIKLNQI